MKHCKSIKGFQWSYIKKEHINCYENNSDKAKIKTIYVYDIFLKKELKFNSIAEACKFLFPKTSNFASTCASISSCCKHKQLNIDQYIFKYEDDIYCLSKKKMAIIDLNSNIIYKNKKILKSLLNLSDKEIKQLFKENKLQYV